MVQARLRASWLAHSRRRRLIKFASLATAAAAAIVAIVSTSILLRQRPKDLVATDESPGPKYLMNAPDQFGSREPNVVERLAMMQKSPPHAVQVSNAKASEQDDPNLARELVQRVMDPATRRPALDALQRMNNPPIKPLVQELGSPLVEQRFAAARALAVVNDPSVVPMLCRMVASDVNRREALAALVLCDDPAARQAVTAAAKSSRSIDAQLRVLHRELKRS